MQDDPLFEDTQGLTITRNTALSHGPGQVLAASQQVNVRHMISPQQGRNGRGMPLFSGCTIHNIVINVQPQNQQK